MRPVRVAIGAGELLDRITILEIKSDHARSADQLKRIGREIERLKRAQVRAGLALPTIDRDVAALRSINRKLWQIEDQLRVCERAKHFGPRFVSLARTVYKHNDRRAEIKRRIDERHGSHVRDEKIYSVTAPVGGR
jgi:hypothetical protein